MDLELTEVYDFMRQNFRGKVYPEVGMYRYSPTGELYWTVVPNGIKKEGKSKEFYESSLEAIEQYKKTVLEIFNTSWYRHSYKSATRNANSETLYFRRTPVLIEHEGIYSVWSRFLISDKPVIEDFEKFLEDKRKCAGATF
jgi:hypothetical protein